MSRKPSARIAVVAVGLALALTGCASDNFRDVEGVPSTDADSYTLINNLDGNPNLVIVCHEGVAIMTSTREYGDAITRVPEWDATCPPATADLTPGE